MAPWQNSGLRIQTRGLWTWGGLPVAQDPVVWRLQFFLLKIRRLFSISSPRKVGGRPLLESFSSGIFIFHALNLGLFLILV